MYPHRSSETDSSLRSLDGEGKCRQAWTFEAIRAGALVHTHTLTPWRHNTLNPACVLLVMTLMGVTVWAGQHAPWRIDVLAAALILGWNYVALFILGIHEASHGMVLRASDRRQALLWNPMSGWVNAVFFAVDHRSLRPQRHLERHVRPLEPPALQGFGVPNGNILRNAGLADVPIARHLLSDRTVGPNPHRDGTSASIRGAIVAFVVIRGMPLTGATWTWGWHVPLTMFWGLHMVAVFNLVKRGREHGGPIGQEADPMYGRRSRLLSGRYLLMPFNLRRHVEHHLDFTVSWHDHGRLHTTLRYSVPATGVARHGQQSSPTPATRPYRRSEPRRSGPYTAFPGALLPPFGPISTHPPTSLWHADSLLQRYPSFDHGAHS